VLFRSKCFYRSKNDWIIHKNEIVLGIEVKHFGRLSDQKGKSKRLQRKA